MEYFSSPLLNPLKPGMLVKNSLAVAWILQNPTAGRKIKETLETALSGHPWGVGRGELVGAGLASVSGHTSRCLEFSQQAGIIFISLFCKIEVCPTASSSLNLNLNLH